MNVKLKPLISDLFERIMPHGISQLVNVPTHAQQGIATKCLDHIYSTNPEKLSEVTAEFTGMSDHKIIKISKYTKSLKTSPRYVRKRCSKNFNKDVFQQKVSEMPELKTILECQCASKAADMFTTGLTKVLDILAPIKTIQNRNNYAPHLQETTKNMMQLRDAAQRKAAESGSQDEWREYRGFRNQCVSTQKLLKTCGWLSVNQQEIYATSLLAHKISITNQPQNLSKEIIQPHSVNTRAAAQGNIRYGDHFRGESEQTRSSFKYRAMKYYNSLPGHMKKQKVATFKVNLKKYSAENIPLR